MLSWYQRLDNWNTAMPAYAALAAVLLYIGIGNHGFISMEGMIEDGSRHMLDTGDWLVPYIYNELYTYKPPLAYWLASIPLSATDGVPPEWFFRLPFVTSAALLGFAVLILIGRAVTPLAGFTCALATTGTGLMLEKVQLAEFDTPLALFVGLSTTLAIVVLSSDRNRPLLWLITYLALFLGLLAKGVPALMMFAPGILLAAFFTGQIRRLFNWDHLLAAGTLVGLIALYVWSVIDAVGWAGFTLPAQEAQIRGFTWDFGSFGRTLTKPLVVVLAFAPFTALLPRVWAYSRGSSGGQATRLMRLGAGFALAGVIAFTVVPTFETRYFLPLAAPIGIACGLAAYMAMDDPASRLEVMTLRILVALLVIFVPVSWFVYRANLPIIALLGFVATASTWAVTTSPAKRGWVIVNLLLISLFIGFSNGLVMIQYKAQSRNLSAVANRLSTVLPSDARVCTNGPANDAGKYSSLFTYLDRDIYIVDPFNTANVEWCVFWKEDWQQIVADEKFLIELTIEHPYKTFILARKSNNMGGDP